MSVRSRPAHVAHYLGTAAFRAARGYWRRAAAALGDAARAPAEVFDEARLRKLLATGATAAAIRLCEDFLRRQPAHPRARLQLVQLHDQRGDVECAIACLEHPAAADDATLQLARVNAELRNPAATNASLLALHRAWVRRFLPVPTARAWAAPRRPGPLRLGAHWTDWDCATIKFQFLPVVRALRARGVEVHGFSPRREPPFIHAALDALHLTRGLGDAALAARIRGLGLDVMLELHGLLPGHRFGALAHRCAPVQISYLNYTSTAAVPNVDYLLADALATPPGVDHHYTEKIWRLPGCFFCFDYRGTDAPSPAPPPVLHTGRFTFGCFGSATKLNASVVALWARVLEAVPNSRLLLMNHGLAATDNRAHLLARFAAQGVAPERVELRPGGPRAAVLHTYAEVDVSLDTFPYNGGNTIAESLWQGVPVITLRGARFSARYGSSLIAAAGLSELAAESEEEFVHQAALLAQDPRPLRDWRRDLRAMCLRHGLGDTEKFAQNLLVAFAKMGPATDG